MTGPERGFLLLTSHLGDPDRNCLTTAQFRTLALRAEGMEPPARERELSEEDLLDLGYNRETAERILHLLSQEDVLDHYLAKGKERGCVPVPRIRADYPALLRKRLGWDAPGCLWARGDLSILHTPAIALVGSRMLRPENRDFAAAVGEYAAKRGWTLVSGNARGADRTAQEACLQAGGNVISIVADELDRQELRENILYLSEDGFSEAFSAQRALSRNRCIHCLGQLTFVAQSELKKGGSWQGTANNLRHNWSPVFCFRDGSEASLALEQKGAWLIGTEDLAELEFSDPQLTIF